MTLRLTDLNDFIAPAQGCIKPPSLPLKSEEIQVELADKVKPVGINLNDCLACSGCITSAESVLISMQSQEEFLRHLQEGTKKVLVVSISPQTRTIFAQKYQLSQLEVMQKVTWFFVEYLSGKYEGLKGKSFVFDTCVSRDFSLRETAKEFVARFKGGAGQTPMLTSACPGWICYAEKMHGSFVLPYISTVRSPQQIMGSLVKSHFAQLQNLVPSDIYHASIMPCFDKKLEASREDFYEQEWNCRDVDCVLSSLELESLISSLSLDMRSIPVSRLHNALSKIHEDENGNQILLGTEGTSSGGYLHFTLMYALKVVFGKELNDPSVNVEKTVGRNSDHVTYTLTIDNEPKMKFIQAYGFRNIQNIVRQLKKPVRSGQEPFASFIEVMACPSGCINGGGQLKVDPQPGQNTASPIEVKAFINLAENLYQSVRPVESPMNSKVDHLYSNWLHNDSNLVRKYLHTQYHNIKDFAPESMSVSTQW